MRVSIVTVVCACVCVTATLVSLKSELVVGTINRRRVMQAEEKTPPEVKTRTNFLFIFSCWTQASASASPAAAAAVAASSPPADAQEKPLATIFVSKMVV